MSPTSTANSCQAQVSFASSAPSPAQEQRFLRPQSSLGAATGRRRSSTAASGTERASPSFVHRTEGGYDGLDPSRRKVEANEGRCEAAVGKTDRRRPHPDQRQPGKARGDNSGAI